MSSLKRVKKKLADRTADLRTLGCITRLHASGAMEWTFVADKYPVCPVALR